MYTFRVFPVCSLCISYHESEKTWYLPFCVWLILPSLWSWLASVLSFHSFSRLSSILSCVWFTFSSCSHQLVDVWVGSIAKNGGSILSYFPNAIFYYASKVTACAFQCCFSSLVPGSPRWLPAEGWMPVTEELAPYVLWDFWYAFILLWGHWLLFCSWHDLSLE